MTSAKASSRARTLFGSRVALVHCDVGTGDAAANVALAAELTPLILPLLCPGAILASDPVHNSPSLSPLPLPDGVTPGRYHLYRAAV